jgi:DNA-binding CsgD family transcriptional regulator
MVIVALVELFIVAADGLVGSPFAAFTLTSVGIAVIVAPPRIVWQCVGVLLVCYLVGVFLGHTPAALVRDGDLAGVVGQAAGYPFAALGLLALAAVFKRFVANASEILEGIRSGVPALTPSLGNAILSPGATRLALPPGRPPSARLTPTEVKVVKGLAAGKAPKQLALEWGVSLATIRTHIRNAKAKTRARTIRQLVALAARPGWPEAAE